MWISNPDELVVAGCERGLKLREPVRSFGDAIVTLLDHWQATKQQFQATTEKTVAEKHVNIPAELKDDLDMVGNEMTVLSRVPITSYNAVIVNLVAHWNNTKDRENAIPASMATHVHGFYMGWLPC
jgi:hypothetical protein